MGELSMRELAARQMDRLSENRQRNREQFPETARIMDVLAIFSPRVVWTEENGRRLGKHD